MADVLRILRVATRMIDAAPRAYSLGVAINQARHGDPAAVEFLRRQGVYEAADLVAPGAGLAAREFTGSVGSAIDQFRHTMGGDVIDAEYRVVDSGATQPPWTRFANWLKAREWGTFVILGPKGSGKTHTAMHLAEAWQDRLGYPVDTVNVYDEDRPDFARPMSLSRFVAIAAAIRELVDPSDETLYADGQDSEYDTASIEVPSLDRLKKRILVIDEAGLAIGKTGMDPVRDAVRVAMTQARHLKWLVIYVGQFARQLPPDLLASETTLMKRPHGDEGDVDRENRLVQRLWSNATEEFDGLRTSPYWDTWPDTRSWAYAYCRNLGGQDHGYQGLVPIGLGLDDELED